MGNALLLPRGLKFGGRESPLGLAANGRIDPTNSKVFFDDFLKFNSANYTLSGAGSPTRTAVSPGILQMATSATSGHQNIIDGPTIFRLPDLEPKKYQPNTVVWSLAVRFRLTAADYVFSFGILSNNVTTDAAIDPADGYQAAGIKVSNPLGFTSASFNLDGDNISAGAAIAPNQVVIGPLSLNTWYTAEAVVKFVRSTASADWRTYHQMRVLSGDTILGRTIGRNQENFLLSEYANGARLALGIETQAASVTSAEIDYIYGACTRLENSL